MPGVQDPEMPKGWLRERVEDKDESGRVRRVRYTWYSPKTGKEFRSRLDATRFQQVLELLKGDEEEAWSSLQPDVVDDGGASSTSRVVVEPTTRATRASTSTTRTPTTKRTTKRTSLTPSSSSLSSSTTRTAADPPSRRCASTRRDDPPPKRGRGRPRTSSEDPSPPPPRKTPGRPPGRPRSLPGPGRPKASPGPGRSSKRARSVEPSDKKKDDNDTKNADIVVVDETPRVVKECKGLPLPPGWKIKEKTRTTGSRVGFVDQYWLSPKTGKVLRSRVDIERFLRALDLAKGDEDVAFDHRNSHHLIKQALTARTKAAPASKSTTATSKATATAAASSRAPSKSRKAPTKAEASSRPPPPKKTRRSSAAADASSSSSSSSSSSANATSSSSPSKKKSERAKPKKLSAADYDKLVMATIFASQSSNKNNTDERPKRSSARETSSKDHAANNHHKIKTSHNITNSNHHHHGSKRTSTSTSQNVEETTDAKDYAKPYRPNNRSARAKNRAQSAATEENKTSTTKPTAKKAVAPDREPVAATTPGDETPVKRRSGRPPKNGRGDANGTAKKAEGDKATKVRNVNRRRTISKDDATTHKKPATVSATSPAPSKRAPTATTKDVRPPNTSSNEVRAKTDERSAAAPPFSSVRDAAADRPCPPDGDAVRRDVANATPKATPPPTRPTPDHPVPPRTRPTPNHSATARTATPNHSVVVAAPRSDAATRSVPRRRVRAPTKRKRSAPVKKKHTIRAGILVYSAPAPGLPPGWMVHVTRERAGRKKLRYSWWPPGDDKKELKTKEKVKEYLLRRSNDDADAP